MTWLETRVVAVSDLRPAAAQEARALIVMPFTDARAAVLACRQLSARAGAAALLLQVLDDERRGLIACANAAAAAIGSPFVGYVAQDAFAGRDRLKRALLALQVAKGGLLAFNDGKWDAELAAFGLAARTWFGANYAGALFFRGYRSHFADVELTLLARQAGAFVRGTDCLLIEGDAMKDGKGVDGADRMLFNERCRKNDGPVRLAPAQRRAFG